MLKTGRMKIAVDCMNGIVAGYLDTFLKGWLKSASLHDSDVPRPGELRPEN